MNEKEVELVVERLTRRVEQANTYFLKKIAQTIKKIKKLKPTEAQKLVQILKYGGDYEDIVKKIQKYTSMNLDDIDKIFSNYAKKDQQFNEKFYRYRNIPFLKYDENTALKRQTEALSNIARNDMFNFSRTNVLGYTTRDLKGNLKFTGLRETYNNVLDEALLNVGQGKETFDSAVGRILNELGESGIRTLNYESGRSVRLDSAVKMHLQSRLRELHNETQQMIGKEIDADGIEITVHEFPAPDHEDVQGRQFSNEEFDKLQAGDFAKGYNGITYTLDHDNKNGYRPISEMNCYHTIFSIVLGVSKPRYSDDQLKKIKEDNEKGFELDGKHYTMYEGTQIQRRLEREIRSQKDIQIMSKEADNKELLAKSQTKINQLTKKYNELNKVSGLKPKRDRMKVSGYHKVKVAEPIIKQTTIQANKNRSIFDKLKDESVIIKYNEFENEVDKELMESSLNQFDNLVNKYPVLKDKINKNGFSIEIDYSSYPGEVNPMGDKMTLGKKYYCDKETFMSTIKEGQDDNWSAKINEKDYDIYTMTHETGHVLEDAIIEKRFERMSGMSIEEYKYKADFAYYSNKAQEDTKIFNEIFVPASEELGVGWKELYDKYISDYGKSENNYEWFAELFTKMELGEQDVMTERLRKYLGDELWKK